MNPNSVCSLILVSGILKGMKLLIVYRPNSEHATTAETFMRDFERQVSGDFKTEVVDLNTREGAATASLYDIVQYPAVLVTTDDGQVLRMWQDEMLPLMNEVSSYLHS